MKHIYFLLLFVLIITKMQSQTLKFNGSAQEPFVKTVINNGSVTSGSSRNDYNFQHPFDIFIGPDDSLWVNERSGIISKVHKSNGGRRIVLNISSLVTFTRTGSGASVTGIAQDGMFGMALHPDAFKGLGKDSLFVAYCYGGAAARKTRISRFYYNPTTKVLVPGSEFPLIQNLPGSNDHNGGRLVFGPDKTLYFSCGDQGANQFGNACISLKSQNNISSGDFTAQNWTNYAGHILRLTTGGTVPGDNPTFGGVKSHMFSKGHRNPQGLVFEKDGTGIMPSNAKLYESEQGAVIDDEVNYIESGKNYGWPYISGYNDNVFYTYKNWSASPITAVSTDIDCGNYNNVGECGTATNMTGANAPKAENYFTPANGFNETFTDPLKSQAAVTTTNCFNNDYLSRPTVAWSSIEYYNNTTTGIPGWSNSLLLTTLKNSSILRYKLNTAGTAILADTIQYFRVQEAGNPDWGINRYRDLVVAADGVTFYAITDSLGATSGVTAGGGAGGSGPKVKDEGKIISFKYTGITLSLNPTTINERTINDLVKIYPNPVTEYFVVNTKDLDTRPYTLNLIDANGRVILQRNITNALETIMVKEIPNGQYLMTLTNRNGKVISTKKVSIIH
jgi:aldose sugar dehydrogenase